MVKLVADRGTAQFVFSWIWFWFFDSQRTQSRSRPFLPLATFCQNYLCSDHNSGLTALFAMSLCHRITNETRRVLYSCFVQTNLSEFLHFLPKSGGYTQLPMFLSPLGTFPGSVALWGVKLLWSKAISKTFCSSSRSMLFKVITAILCPNIPLELSVNVDEVGWNRF